MGNYRTTDIYIFVRNLTRYANNERLARKMKTLAAILVILFTMPVSYAMLDVATRKLRIRDRMES